MKCQILFFGDNKKNVKYIVQILPTVLSVKLLNINGLLVFAFFSRQYWPFVPKLWSALFF